MDKVLNFKTFKEKLRDPSSYRIKDQLLHFLNSFTETETLQEQKSKVHNFTLMFEENLPKYPCWRLSKYTEIEEASEVLEFMITKDKYSLLFGSNPLYREQDETLSRAYELLAFLKPEHLDISPSVIKDNLIQVAGNQLIQINNYTSPREKLICISNCFRIINQIIVNAHQGNNSHGADESLPLFIYVLLKSKVPNLFGNFAFIKNFRYKARREYRDPVEFKYTFTSLKIALKFIIEIKSSKLHLAPGEDFKEFIRLGKKKHQSTQTSLEDSNFAEVELRSFAKLKYTGEISVNHFINNPGALASFIDDYNSLLAIKKSDL